MDGSPIAIGNDVDGGLLFDMHDATSYTHCSVMPAKAGIQLWAYKAGPQLSLG
jgi:hypothetical protein